MPMPSTAIGPRRDRAEKLERMLDEMRQRGYVRRWIMEQRYDTRQHCLAVEYGNGRRQTWVIDQDLLMNTPQYADYICERIERDLMREIAERGPDMMADRPRYMMVDPAGYPGVYTDPFPYREPPQRENKPPKKTGPVRKPEQPALSPSNAYRFDYLEFMEVKR